MQHLENGVRDPRLEAAANVNRTPAPHAHHISPGGPNNHQVKIENTRSNNSNVSINQNQISSYNSNNSISMGSSHNNGQAYSRPHVTSGSTSFSNK